MPYSLSSKKQWEVVRDHQPEMVCNFFVKQGRRRKSGGGASPIMSNNEDLVYMSKTEHCIDCIACCPSGTKKAKSIQALTDQLIISYYKN